MSATIIHALIAENNSPQKNMTNATPPGITREITIGVAFNAVMIIAMQGCRRDTDADCRICEPTDNRLLPDKGKMKLEARRIRMATVATQA